MGGGKKESLVRGTFALNTLITSHLEVVVFFSGGFRAMKKTHHESQVTASGSTSQTRLRVHHFTHSTFLFINRFLKKTNVLFSF